MKDTILWSDESDRYTDRAQLLHRENLYSAASDATDARTIAKLAPLRRRRIRSILDIGCGYGGLTFALARQFPRARVVGVDPGKRSVALATRSLRAVKNVSFMRGYAHDIPLDRQFDLVVLRMVMQWIPRELLLQTVAEIDRLCGRFLLIHDFYPSRPLTSVSKHNAAVRIFKQDYAAIFASLPTYKLVAREVGDAEFGDDYRWGRFLLEKRSLDESYGARKGVQQKDKARKRR
jgi:SAM-dependent methyltransferase